MPCHCCHCCRVYRSFMRGCRREGGSLCSGFPLSPFSPPPLLGGRKNWEFPAVQKKVYSPPIFPSSFSSLFFSPPRSRPPFFSFGQRKSAKLTKLFTYFPPPPFPPWEGRGWDWGGRRLGTAAGRGGWELKKSWEEKRLCWFCILKKKLPLVTSQPASQPANAFEWNLTRLKQFLPREQRKNPRFNCKFTI